MSNVPIIIEAGKHPGRGVLLDCAGVKISGLLSDDERLQYLFRRRDPSDSHAGTERFGKSAQMNHHPAPIQRGKRFQSSASVAKLTIRVVFKDRNPKPLCEVNEMLSSLG